MIRKKWIFPACWLTGAGVAFALTAQARPDDAKAAGPAVPPAQAQGFDQQGNRPASDAKVKKDHGASAATDTSDGARANAAHDDSKNKKHKSEHTDKGRHDKGSHGDEATHRKPEQTGKPEHAGHSEGLESAGKANGGPGNGSPHGRGDASGAHRHAGKNGSGVGELRARYKSGTLKKEDLKRELEALKASRNERRKEHRAHSRDRWGDSVAVPPLRQELLHHERRMARLNRALLVAETERKGAAKDKLTLRIEKLIAHETERHERKMVALQAKAASAPAALPTTHGVALGKAPAHVPGHASAEKEAEK